MVWETGGRLGMSNLQLYPGAPAADVLCHITRLLRTIDRPTPGRGPLPCALALTLASRALEPTAVECIVRQQQSDALLLVMSLPRQTQEIERKKDNELDRQRVLSRIMLDPDIPRPAHALETLADAPQVLLYSDSVRCSKVDDPNGMVRMR